LRVGPVGNRDIEGTEKIRHIKQIPKQLQIRGVNSRFEICSGGTTAVLAGTTGEGGTATGSAGVTVGIAKRKSKKIR
jgi:hypothetical protein